MCVCCVTCPLVSDFLQSASVTAGVRKIIASCTIANSKPKAFCIVVISNNSSYTFQVGQNHVTLDYPPGEYSVSIRIHENINGNLVITEESTFWLIFVPSIDPSSSSSSTLVLSSTMGISSLSSTATSFLSRSLSLTSLPGSSMCYLYTNYKAMCYS